MPSHMAVVGHPCHPHSGNSIAFCLDFLFLDYRECMLTCFDLLSWYMGRLDLWCGMFPASFSPSFGKPYLYLTRHSILFLPSSWCRIQCSLQAVAKRSGCIPRTPVPCGHIAKIAWILAFIHLQDSREQESVTKKTRS